MIKFRFFR